jgi:hypothetical protein
MSYTELAKSAVTLVASAGVGAVVTNAIKATTPEDLKIASKITVVVGTLVASRAVADVASTYCSKQIDELKSGVGQIRNTIKTLKKD